MNISKLSVRAIRDQINAGLREVTFRTDDGAMTQMVYIPKFRIPAGIWDGGMFPPTDLNLGGFFIDKYECSHKAATNTSRGIGDNPTVAVDSTTDVAVSLPGKVPWTVISHPNAKQACANRKINGVRCHLVTMKEWMTVVWLAKLLGHDIRGNNYWGRDYRDPDSHEYYGAVDVSLASYSKQYSPNKVYSRVLTGSGPISWSHNGMANGIFDIVGNVWEWIDFVVDSGIYQAIKTAQINDPDGITATDTAIVIDNVQDLQYWPTSNGLILIKAEGANTDEYVIYGSLVDNGDGTVTLSGCQRGQKGTAPSAHANDAQVQQINEYCIIPGGYGGKIADSGLNNTTNPATFTYSDLVLGPGGAQPAVGDILQCQNEQLEVTAVNGASLTVNRGANGSAIAAHPQGTRFARLSPQMSNYNPSATGDYGAYQSARFNTLRTEPELVTMGLPFSASSSEVGDWRDLFEMRIYGQRAAFRGGYWHNGSYARCGVALGLGHLPSYVGIDIGFRAALSL